MGWGGPGPENSGGDGIECGPCGDDGIARLPLLQHPHVSSYVSERRHPSRSIQIETLPERVGEEMKDDRTRQPKMYVDCLGLGKRELATSECG